MTLMGLCSEVAPRASELDYTNYEGDYEFEMGIGREPGTRPCWRTPTSWSSRGARPSR